MQIGLELLELIEEKFIGVACTFGQDIVVGKLAEMPEVFAGGRVFALHFLNHASDKPKPGVSGMFMPFFQVKCVNIAGSAVSLRR